jgi:hypothetical protein
MSVFAQARQTLKNLKSKASSAAVNLATNFVQNGPINFSNPPNLFDSGIVGINTNKGIQNGKLTPRVTGIPLLDQGSRNVTNFVQNYTSGQVINPAKQGFQDLRKPGLLNKSMGVAGIVGAGFNATPMGAAWNVGIAPVIGGIQSIRTGQPLTRTVSNALYNPSSIAMEGLGIQNPFIALGVDVLATHKVGNSFSKSAPLLGAIKKGALDPNTFDNINYMRKYWNRFRVDGNLKDPTPMITEEWMGRFGNKFPKLGTSGRSKNTPDVETMLKDLEALRDRVFKDQKILANKTPVSTGYIKKENGLFAGKKPNDNFSIPKMGFADEIKPALQSQNAQINTPKLDFDPDSYVKELVQKQKNVRSNSSGGFKNKIASTLSDLKAKLVDETAPIQDVLTAAEKKGRFKVLPSHDVRLQVDKVLRSKNLASQFADDNGLTEVIKSARDIDALDQYMIAKHAGQVEGMGIKTGRNLAKDKALVESLTAEYEPLAQKVSAYSRKLLDYSVDRGLISKELAESLKVKYPDYVPLQRIFDELEQPKVRGTGKGIASISSQSVVQRLKGSEREIASPIESLLLKTQDAFSQGERNVAARQLASYKDLPGFEGLIVKVKEGSKAPHTISFIDNGVKRTFATTKEISEAAKALNVEQMGFLGKIISVPTRILQLGATGLNVPFVVTNMVKDELTGFINSNRAAKTSLLNPGNFVKALFSAAKHDELYKEVVRNAAGGTSFDIAREAPKLAVDRIRAGRNVGSKIKYTVRHPGELIRALEDFIGRSEEMGRIKNYAGTKEALLKEGRTLQDATLLGAKAARENTANFARRGSWGRVLNWVIPYFNAGIQGSRSLVNAFARDPKGTGAKVAITVFAPIAATTAWNLSDPARKSVYEDIPQWEKENNIIIVPDGAKQDAKGRWNVIKIPLPPGLSNLGSLVRRPMEQASGLDPVRFAEIATNLITASTSVDLSSQNKIASTFVPQIAKPFVESVTNTNLFTGQKIVPEYLKDAPAQYQVKPGTSKVATKIGKMTNISPLKIENFASSQLGGLGSQLLGKESIAGNLERRFSKASGGNLLDRVYDESTKVSSLKSQIKKLTEAGDTKEAMKLVRENREILSKTTAVGSVRSKVDDLVSARNKVKSNTTISVEQKERLLKLINDQLYQLSISYNSIQN